MIESLLEMNHITLSVFLYWIKFAKELSNLLSNKPGIYFILIYVSFASD